MAGSGRRATHTRHVELRLLDAFALSCDGKPVELPMSAQRVLAFIALHERPLLRSFVAGSLWLHTDEERAQANLRSALWRLAGRGVRVVEASGRHLALGESVWVDLRASVAAARATLRDQGIPHSELGIDALDGELLPDWYDDWVLLERERHRQLRLQALEALSDRFLLAGRVGEALDAALAAVGGEPLRESAHCAVMRVHIAQGNTCEAIRQYNACCALFAEHLGMEPSERMQRLVFRFPETDAVTAR